MKNAELNTKFASVLIDNLARFDSRGYDKQGYHAVCFLGAIARHGYIPREDFVSYLNDFVVLNEETNWFTVEASDRADDFIELLRAYLVFENDSTAQDIINFPR